MKNNRYNQWSNCGSQQWTDKYLTWLLWSGLLHVQNNSPCKGRSITEDEDKLSSWESEEEKVSGFSSAMGLSSSRGLVARSWEFCVCWLNFSSNFSTVWYTEEDESFSWCPFIIVEWSLSSFSWNRFKSTICFRIVCLSWSHFDICKMKLNV